MAYFVAKAKWVSESDYEQHVSGRTANQIKDVLDIYHKDLLTVLSD